MRSGQFALPLLLIMTMAACSTPRARGEPEFAASAVTTGTAANDKLDAVAWTQGSAEFHAASLQAFVAARRAVDAGVKDSKWDALPPEERDSIGNRPQLRALPMAVIADVDETLLDNTPFNVRLILDPLPAELAVDDSRKAFSRLWNDWVKEEGARALPGAAEFASHLEAGGVAFYYITNRDDEGRDATCRNLRARGFPVPDCDTFVLTRNDADGRPSAKLSRRAMVGRTHRVLAMLGDNLGDFVDGIETDRSGRLALVTEHQGWWGERWQVLPNPIYGSWETAAGPLPSNVTPTTFAAREAAIRTAKIRGLDAGKSR